MRRSLSVMVTFGRKRPRLKFEVLAAEEARDAQRAMPFEAKRQEGDSAALAILTDNQDRLDAAHRAERRDPRAQKCARLIG